MPTDVATPLSALHGSTLSAQGNSQHCPPFGDIVRPIHLSTTFERAADGSYPGGRTYARDQSPAYDDAEAVLCALEGGRASLLFASGLAAATSVVQALAPGDRVLAPRACYWAWRKWLLEVATPWGIRVDWYDNADTAHLALLLAAAPTRLVWIETPANPTWEVTDIAEVAHLARAHGALVVVDSTVATPVLTRPLALGAHLVLHSATKYLNGHSDVVAGALVAGDLPDALWMRIRQIRGLGGAVLGPFEAWLLVRGMRTLYLRVHAASANALRLAHALTTHPAVLEVLYPGLPQHAGHAIAARQMQGGFSGMLSVRMVGGETAAIAAAGRLRLFRQATSLGSVESLVEHRASVEGPDSMCPRDLLRLSVGIEHADDLLADLQQALIAT